MKRAFGFVLVSFASIGFAFGQDNNYYSNNNDNYNGDNNNGYYDQSYAYNNSSYGNDDNVAGYQTFYDQLSPYGQWVDYPGYGYVFSPAVAEGFTPYLTGGHWVYSDYGWTWASDYAFGWATFHYGRWFHDDAYGWMWKPGSEWAPAWVTWGSYSGYYCWAPLEPFVEISTYYRPEASYWNFVPCEHIYQENLGGYCANNSVFIQNNYTTIANNITVINNANVYNNTTYFAGPRKQEVERISGRSIAQLSIASVSHPVESRVAGNQLNIYRPQIQRSTAVNNGVRQQVMSRPATFSNVQRSNINTAYNNHAFRSGALQNQRVQQYEHNQNISRPVNIQQLDQVRPHADNNAQFERQQQPINHQANQQQFNQVKRPQQQFTQPQHQLNNQVERQQYMPAQRQQTFTQPQHQDFQQPQRMATEQRSYQPAQRQPERTFASTQEPAVHSFQPAVQNNRPSNNLQAYRGRR